MKKIFLLLLIAALFSCQKIEYPVFPEKSPIIGLALPLQLGPGGNEIFLTDYFPNTSVIDSVYFNGRKLSLSEDKTKTYIRAPQDGAPMMEMTVWSKAYAWSVPVKGSRKLLTTLTLDPQGRTFSRVQLSGEFNGWIPSRNEMQFKDGKWQAAMYLNPGTYMYRVVIDGESVLDPGNPEKVDNNFGGFNSVLHVGLDDKEKLPFLFTEETEDGDLEIGATAPVDAYVVYWQNFKLDPVFLEKNENNLEITIPQEAKNYELSYIRVYAYNDAGLANDLLIPLAHGEVVTSPEKLGRSDFHTASMYNVFIDRFFDGDPTNNPPKTPEVLPPADFHGGDLAGVIEKIKTGYFNDLGVNTLWISPVIKNPVGPYGHWDQPVSKFSAYHGYWPISFTEIDSRFGTAEQLSELVRLAHDNNLNVLLDFVAHHVHKEHPYYKQHPDRVTPLYLPDGRVNTQLWDEQRLTTWFDTFLPTLDLQNMEVTNMLVDSAVWWLQKYNLDGFRHDATKHIPEVFWRTLTKRVKQQIMVPRDKMIYQIGETYGSAELIGSYVNPGELDAQFDFNVYDAAIGAFARKEDPFTRLDQVLHESFEYYGYHNTMGYITGNQDRGRFISYAGGDLKFDEDAKLAGWNRDIGTGDPVSYQRLSMLTAFNMTIPGIPVIYYGDEIGIPGGNDPDSRRMMKFDQLDENEVKTRETAQKLLELRNSSLALTYGDFYTLQADKKTYAFLRKYFEDNALVLFNKSDEAVNFSLQLPEWADVENLKSNFGNNFELRKNVLTLTLQPWSFEILTSQ